MPVTATSWKTVGSSWTAQRPRCAPMRTSRNSISGYPRRVARATATSSTTAVASAGWHSDYRELYRGSLPLSLRQNRGEAKMRVTLGVFGLFLATGLSIPAHAQALPPGSYQQSCREIRMHGPTLTAICRTARDRGEQPTALNVAHCVGD